MTNSIEGGMGFTEGGDSKDKVLEDLKNFLKKLETEHFEDKFWWHGHDEKSGQEEKEKYENSEEYKKLWNLVERARTLGLVKKDQGFSLMVKESAEQLLDLLKK